MRAGQRLVGLGLAAGLLGPVLSVPASAATLEAAPAAGTVTVGSQVLHACGRHTLVDCGVMAMPLDWSDPAGPKISVCFEWFPATDRALRPKARSCRSRAAPATRPSSR